MMLLEHALPIWMICFSVLMHLSRAELNGKTDSYKRVCYSTNWSQYRPEPGKFSPHDIDPSLCTHLVYAFAKINHKGELAPYEWNDIPYPHLYKQFTDFKKLYPGLKTLLAVGGWSHPSQHFTRMVRTRRSRRLFIDHAIQYLRVHQFDGLDLDWEYPAHRGSPPGDRERFSALVRELRDSFEREARDTNRPRLLLTAALGASYKVIDTAYQVPNIASHLDFINLMAYDLHGGWNNILGFNAPLYGLENGTPHGKLNVDWVIRRYLDLGVPKHKLVLGIPLYGRTYQLCSAKDVRPGAPACGRGHPRFYTKEVGFMAYYEIILGLNDNWVRGWDDEQRCPYAYSLSERTWVSYDDRDSIYYKIKYLKELGLGGVMVWALDLDDFNHIASKTPRYPLMRAVNEFLLAGEDAQKPALTTPSKQAPDLSDGWLLPVYVNPVGPATLNMSHKSAIHPAIEHHATSHYPKLGLTYLDHDKQSAGLKREPRFKTRNWQVNGSRKTLYYDPHGKEDGAKQSPADRLKPLIGGTWSDLIRNVLNVPLRNDKLPSYVYRETKTRPRQKLPWGGNIDMGTTHNDTLHVTSVQQQNEGKNQMKEHEIIKNSNDVWKMYSWQRNNRKSPAPTPVQRNAKASQRHDRNNINAWLVMQPVQGNEFKSSDFSPRPNSSDIKELSSQTMDAVALTESVNNTHSKIGTAEKNHYTYLNSSPARIYVPSGITRSYADKLWAWSGNRNVQFKFKYGSENMVENKNNNSGKKMDATASTHHTSRLETIEPLKDKRLSMKPLVELAQKQVTNKLPPHIPVSLAKIRRRKGPNNGHWIQHDDGHWKRVGQTKRNIGPYRRIPISNKLAYNNKQYRDVKSVTEITDVTSTVASKDTNLETEIQSVSTKKVTLVSATSTSSPFDAPKAPAKASLELVVATQMNKVTIPDTTINAAIDNLEFQCPAAFGIFADFEMCDHFYQCVWSVTLHYRCSPGTWWSTGMQTCVWPSQSDCGKQHTTH